MLEQRKHPHDAVLPQPASHPWRRMEIKVTIPLLVCQYSLVTDNISENTPPVKRLTRSNRGQGGRADQMEKISNAITRQDKQKKTTLTEIQDDVSDNPMAIPPKNHRKANKVFVD